MANIIKTITDLFGNKIYPKTKEMAIYDESNVRLDNKLVGMDGKFLKYLLPPKVINNQSELDIAINNIPTINSEWYRSSINVLADLTLGGGVWYIEGFKTNTNYEWQKATSYHTNNTRCMSRVKWDGTWLSWNKDVISADIVQSDTVTSYDKIPSAYVMSVVSGRVNTINNNLVVYNLSFNLTAGIEKRVVAVVPNGKYTGYEPFATYVWNDSYQMATVDISNLYFENGKLNMIVKTNVTAGHTFKVLFLPTGGSLVVT